MTSDPAFNPFSFGNNWPIWGKVWTNSKVDWQDICGSASSRQKEKATLFYWRFKKFLKFKPSSFSTWSRISVDDFDDLFVWVAPFASRHHRNFPLVSHVLGMNEWSIVPNSEFKFSFLGKKWTSAPFNLPLESTE